MADDDPDFDYIAAVTAAIRREAEAVERGELEEGCRSMEQLALRIICWTLIHEQHAAAFIQDPVAHLSDPLRGHARFADTIEAASRRVVAELLGDLEDEQD